MNKRSYWLELFTGTTWGDFIKPGISRSVGNRPTVLNPSPPVSEIYRFIPFSALKVRINQVSSTVRISKPEFLEAFSESCGLVKA